VVRMEQVACRRVKTRDLPRAKFATHVNHISSGYQEALVARLSMAWGTITSGHIFDQMTREESDDECEMLDARAAVPVGLHSSLTQCQKESTRFK